MKHYVSEGSYQTHLKHRIREILPGAIVLKEDPNDTPGVPDLCILYKTRWATLETKISKNAKHRPRQDWYVDKMNDMSFSAFIYPENEEEVLYAMERALKARR